MVENLAQNAKFHGNPQLKCIPILKMEIMADSTSRRCRLLGNYWMHLGSAETIYRSILNPIFSLT